MSGKIDWKALLKYAVPLAVAAGVGAKVIQRQKRMEEFNKLYIEPLKQEYTLWEDAVGRMQVALRSLDENEESYKQSKGKQALFEKIKKTDNTISGCSPSKRMPEPDKAREMLEKAVDVLTRTQPVIVLDKNDLMKRINDLCEELKKTTNYKPMQRKIVGVIDDSKKVREDYSLKIKQMENKKNTYIKLLL